MQRDLLATRIAAQQARAATRAQGLRQKLPAGAALLRAHGATRVVLFGSLARDGAAHGASDVDLAVWGLDGSTYFRVLAELAELLGTDVDLVEMEKASASLRERVARDGIELVGGDEPR